MNTKVNGLTAVDIANKMIAVYLSTPVEKYPEARALDVLDDLGLSYIAGNDTAILRSTAFNFFEVWLETRSA